MHRILIIFIVTLTLASGAYASMIARLDLNELPIKSEHIVLGKVIDVSPKDTRDIVTIKVASQLKGKLKNDKVTFILVTRGGLKDFDPKVEVGDMGVFFLNENNGEIEKAYWGSIAIFNKNNFQLKE